MPADTEKGERGAVCIVVDVRALRGIETDLAVSEAVFGQSPMGFMLFGTDLRIMRVNERFATVFGGTPESHRGCVPADYLPPGEADRLENAVRKVLETGSPVTDLQLLGSVRGDEEQHRWTVNLYRLHNAGGRPIGVAGLGTDVTRRRNAEREAASARRNLALLNAAGARIGNSLDLETTARELLAVAVPQFCDIASVDLFQDSSAGTRPRSPRGSAASRCPGWPTAAPRCAGSPSPAPSPAPRCRCPSPTTEGDGGARAPR